MRKMTKQRGYLVVIGMGCLLFGLIDIHGPRGMNENALAADVLKIDSLSNDPKQFRAQVQQLLGRTDILIAKLKDNPALQPVVLDLLQTRDDILRELPKIDAAPGDAKWTAEEMEESVRAKLKLLKEQYDKASESGS